MNLSSQVSASATLAGGLVWVVFGAFAAAGRVRPPRAWAQLGSRWGWCQLLLGAGTTCFPADALLGTYSAPVLSFAGAAFTVSALALLLRRGQPEGDELGEVPPDDSPTYRTRLSGDLSEHVSPHAATRPGVQPFRF